ncbi:hypothetical protein HHL16_21180 [Pseudoflavitalea sp. G-6-1-2]|uniref:DUF7935 family protein n=1 Tax=Pseudoflavitalea sp. G-6-1-2 TaxID=2728841 RepID=UPI00146D269B|nr:hypothetical protein [Pseudoflavitalea sp. G-6-1-2]NML23407.1 hypothetical protein [Pseudoflavitalea sp. G-6-1-2]
MSLSTNELLIALVIAFVLGGSLAFVFWKQRKDMKELLARKQAGQDTDDKKSANVQGLQLQAYERLILLTDRIALPNLINRVNQPGLSARDMQMVLTQHVKQEFEHNVTQQIYVSAESWDAVRNLKDQNILIINQVASFLPAEASGQDLSRALLEMLMQNPKATLHTVVSDVLSFEAKKLMK